MITALKCTSKKFQSARVVTVDFVAFDAIRQSVNNNPHAIIPTTQCNIIDLNYTIHRDNRDRLTQVFGKAACHYKSEFDNHVWLLRYHVTPTFYKDYFVLSAKTKGTCIESYTSELDLDSWFIFKLYEELKDDTGGDAYCWDTDVVGQSSNDVCIHDNLCGFRS